jgi:hypothetical protein
MKTPPKAIDPGNLVVDVFTKRAFIANSKAILRKKFLFVELSY